MTDQIIKLFVVKTLHVHNTVAAMLLHFFSRATRESRRMVSNVNSSGAIVLEESESSVSSLAAHRERR
jgi:hypothetical protein